MIAQLNIFVLPIRVVSGRGPQTLKFNLADATLIALGRKYNMIMMTELWTKRTKLEIQYVNLQSDIRSSSSVHACILMVMGALMKWT